MHLESLALILAGHSSTSRKCEASI